MARDKVLFIELQDVSQVKNAGSHKDMVKPLRRTLGEARPQNRMIGYGRREGVLSEGARAVFPTGAVCTGTDWTVFASSARTCCVGP